MGLRINTNLPSLVAQRHLENNDKELTRSIGHLSSGSRINSAAEDPAGLPISENLRAQVRSLEQASRNANDGVGFVQVAEGGLNEISNILVRLRELSIQASSDTVGDRERKYIDSEFQSLKSEVDRIASSTKYAGIALLSGEAEKSTLDFQVGAFNNENDRIQFNVGDINARISNLSIDGSSTLDIDGARDAIDSVDKALDVVSGFRANLGAIQSRLNSTSNALSVSVENFSAAYSRVHDVDVAHETAALAKQSILKQAGIAVLAQANQEPALALKLL